MTIPQGATVLVTGGAGYVGSALVPQLLDQGYRVRVLDLFLFGTDVFGELKPNAALEEIQGDIRDVDTVARALEGCHAVIHLACISNDPSFELNPKLGRSINFDAFEPLVRMSRAAGVRRFVYASSSSVYGVSDAADVTEDHRLRPLTDYSRYKALCEPILLGAATRTFAPVIVRPATICGWAPRQRLDLVVNILANHAVNRGRMTVFGGRQKRPNLHIADMCDAYRLLLTLDDDRVAGRVYNTGGVNHTVEELAAVVHDTVIASGLHAKVDIDVASTDDPRSYHICSNRIRDELGFVPRRTVADAVRDLCDAFRCGALPDSMTADRYYNVKTMQKLELA
jgi:nucleoside-diphosphate-sugar epimerase